MSPDNRLEDTLVGGGEVFVERPVEDVGDVGAEGVTGARVHRLLCDLSVRHTGALGGRNTIVSVQIYSKYKSQCQTTHYKPLQLQQG